MAAVEVGGDHLAERAGMPGDGRADLEDLHRVVRPEDVVDDEHVVAVEDADPNGFLCAGGQRVRPQEGAASELIVLKEGVAQLEGGDAEPVLAGIGVLFDQIVGFKGAEQPVYRAFGQPESLGQLGDTEAAALGRERFEDERGPLDRLNHGPSPCSVLSNWLRHCRMPVTMVGIVLVSHSSRLVDGLAELLTQIGSSEVPVGIAGGTVDGGLGTSVDLVNAAIVAADRGDGVVVIPDLGSAVLTVKSVLEGVDGRNVVLVDAPFVEGAVAAAVTAATGAGLDAVVRAAEEARDVPKL